MDRHPEIKGLKIDLPVSGGKLETYRLKGAKAFKKPSKPFTRVAYAAAHVVADPLSAKEPGWSGDRLGRDARLPPAPLRPGASASPRRWIPRSAAWDWIGRIRLN
jgi:hypothetical protein